MNDMIIAIHVVHGFPTHTLPGQIAYACNDNISAILSTTPLGKVAGGVAKNALSRWQSQRLFFGLQTFSGVSQSG